MKNIKATEKIPSWLFFGLYESSPQGKWNEDKIKVANRILRSLKQKAEMYHWDISKILHFEEYDNARGYYQEPLDK